MTALRSFPITRVDAFADRPFTGNPAAVMPLEEWLPDAVLQAIAAENNLAETAFLIPDESGEAEGDPPGCHLALPLRRRRPLVTQTRDDCIRRGPRPRLQANGYRRSGSPRKRGRRKS